MVVTNVSIMIYKHDIEIFSRTEKKLNVSSAEDAERITNYELRITNLKEP